MATKSEVDDIDLEIFTLIWLDNTINESVNRETQNDLRKLSNQFKAFDNSNECELYIQSVSNDERIILIVSGRLGRDLVPRIHQIEKIHSIYVYCFDKEGNEKWAKHHPKIQVVLTTEKELIEQLRQNNKKEIYQINDQLLYINTYTKNPNDQFIHSQLLIYHLLNIKIDSTIMDREQFFTLCRAECDEDDTQLKNLEEFQENYSSENCLRWLTKNIFLLNLITDALYTRNIDLLYLSHFYIHDINQQLELHKCSTSIHVYHSHLITNEEIEQLRNSVGELISINTFFITTFQRDKALLALKQANNLQKILFEIDADPSIAGLKPFADITSFTYSTNQSQILFMLGSIFRIGNFYQQDNIWICHMSLSSEYDPDIKTVLEKIKKEDGDTDILAFGNFLARIGQYDDAEKYYQRVLNHLTFNHEDTHICYHNLGNLAYLKKDYDKSLEYHIKSLEFSEYSLQTDDPNIADSYNCLGIVYFNKNDNKQAIDSYEKALKILKLTLDKNHTKVVACLNNIGLAYRTEKDYSKALDYYQEALNIQKRYLSEDHLDLGQTYHNIGALYWCRGCYDDAMKYYNLSLENKTKFLPSEHLSIAMTLENIGLIYENKNDFQQALNYYEQAKNIYQQTLSSTHLDVIQINDNILRVTSLLCVDLLSHN